MNFQKTLEFEARTSGGEKFLIQEWTDILDQQKRLPGLRRLTTAEGKPVNYVRPGVYKIVDENLLVQKVNRETRN